MGCPLWVQIRINVLHRNRILITDTSWIVRKGDAWGVPFEFKIWLIYYITKGSSQQSPHIWLVCTGNTWGVPCGFKFWLMYHITTWSSQHTTLGSYMRAVYYSYTVMSNLCEGLALGKGWMIWRFYGHFPSTSVCNGKTYQLSWLWSMWRM